MIDSYFRSTFQVVAVDPLARLLAKLRIPATVLTALAVLFGVATVPLMLYDLKWWAVCSLLLSGYFDILDGSVARLTHADSPTGAALDICSDRIVESAVIIGLYLVAPSLRGLQCLLMLASILICITSFLVVGIFTRNESMKSFHYSTGLIERTETFLLLSIMILASPKYFTSLSYFFSALVFLTAAIRIFQFQVHQHEVEMEAIPVRRDEPELEDEE